MKSERITTALGEIAEVFTGFPFQSAKYIHTQTGLRVVRGDNVKEGELVWGDKTRCWPSLTEDLYRYSLRVEDVVIGMDGSKVGKNFAALSNADLPAVLAQRVARVRAKEGYSQALLKHLICNPEFTRYVDQVKTGTSIPHISKGQIEEFRVSLPVDRAEQDMIAAFLDKIEAKAALNQRINQLLHEFVLTIFGAWFIDFLPVRAKLSARAEGRNPLRAAISAMSGKTDVELDELPREQYEQLAATAALFPDELVDSELGEVPRGWKVRQVSELAEVVKGKSYKSSELAPSKTALVTLKSFNRGGGYRLDGLKEYTGTYKPNQEVRAGDLIIAFTDVTQAGDVIGKPALVVSDESYDHLVISQDVAVIRPMVDSHRYFLYGLMSDLRFQDHTRAYTSGTTVLHLAKDAVPSFSFVFPGSVLAEAYSLVAAPLFSSIDQHISESRTLSQIRATILPRLLSGELAVPVPDPAA